MTLLQFEVYLYNDEIIREGTIGRKMFFISRGTVRIVNAKTQTHTLTDGAFFGEISLILLIALDFSREKIRGQYRKGFAAKNSWMDL